MKKIILSILLISSVVQGADTQGVASWKANLPSFETAGLAALTYGSYSFLTQLAHDGMIPKPFFLAPVAATVVALNSKDGNGLKNAAITMGAFSAGACALLLFKK